MLGGNTVADGPPFMNAYGNVPKILNKMKNAKTPDKFTLDYLGTILGFKGGGAPHDSATEETRHAGFRRCAN